MLKIESGLCGVFVRVLLKQVELFIEFSNMKYLMIMMVVILGRVVWKVGWIG